ncbi:MAG: hypothetical protein LBI67_00050 [Treponema sp.]|jgi:hypothetical protein|nr:hypothetical protein [Treponema sp.]
MRFLRHSLILLCLFSRAALYAQDAGEDIPIESDWSGYLPSVYSRGDQTFNFNIGPVFPLFYVDSEEGVLPTKMNMGGMAALSYNYFLGPHLFLGGELSGAFFSTEGKNNYFIVPIGARIGYQFIVKRFEFPLMLSAGAALQQRLGGSYFGLYAKPSAGVFFRYSPDWSFGVMTSFWWVPQWTNKPYEGHPKDIDIHGFFLEASIGVRYHF